MPSNTHEGVIKVFQQCPALAVELLSDTYRLPIPGHQEVRVEDPDATNLTPTVFRADSVITLRDGDKPVQAVVVEVQRGKDPDKRWSWPAYVTNVRADKRCPVTLLVVCPDIATVKWCEADIELGHPGLVLRPLVVGPQHVPEIEDGDQVEANPELAVLSVAVHADRREHHRMLDTLRAGLSRIEKDKAARYAEIVLAVLPTVGRNYWEKQMSIMDVPFETEFWRNTVAKAKAEGAAEAEAQAVLDALDARGIPVSDDVRDRITTCTDSDQLKVWHRRAVTADKIDDIFR